MPVNHVPEGFRTVTPYLVVPGAAGVLAFLRDAFGAEVMGPPLTRPDGTIAHASVRIGDSSVMLSDPAGEFGPMPAMVHLYLPDVDDAYRAALRAGAGSVMAPADQFYGDRSAGVKDAAGNVWWLATHVEDVSHEETVRRAGDRAAV